MGLHNTRRIWQAPIVTPNGYCIKQSNLSGFRLGVVISWAITTCCRIKKYNPGYWFRHISISIRNKLLFTPFGKICFFLEADCYLPLRPLGSCKRAAYMKGQIGIKSSQLKLQEIINKYALQNNTTFRSGNRQVELYSCRPTYTSTFIQQTPRIRV